jgi:hypothetical protein
MYHYPNYGCGGGPELHGVLIAGGAWKDAGPNLAAGSDCNAGFCYAPENPVVTTMSSDGKFYLAVYDALEQPPTGASNAEGKPSVCGSKTGCDRIGTAFSADGVVWQHSALVSVQSGGQHPCGQIRTPLGLAPEPERCVGCYSVLWTGITAEKGEFRPVCQAIIRNTAEAN